MKFKRTCVFVLALVFVVLSCVPVSARIYSDTENHWARNAIDVVSDREIMVGTSSTLFSPNLAVNRASFSVVLVKSLGVKVQNNINSGISDVPSAAYYTGSAKWAVENGLMNLSSGNFRPMVNLTRAEAAMAIVRFCRAFGINCTIRNTDCTFPDTAGYSESQVQEMRTAIQWGFMSKDVNGYFNPNNPVLRSHCAVIIYNLITYYLNSVEPVRFLYDRVEYRWTPVDASSGKLIMTWKNVNVNTIGYPLNTSKLSAGMQVLIDSGFVLAPQTVNDANAKVKFQIASSSKWYSLTREESGGNHNVLAQAEITTNYGQVLSPSNYQIENTTFVSVTVYFSPYLSSFSFNEKTLIPHECLHALGFGHVAYSNTNSVLRGNLSDYDNLQYYDYKALKNKY